MNAVWACPCPWASDPRPVGKIPAMNAVVISPMHIGDHPEAIALWRATEGLGDAPTEATLARFLERNAGFSQVAREGAVVVGALLASFDGIRGYFYRLAVAASHRRRGIGQGLVEAALSALRQAGADRVNLHLFADNVAAHAFWSTVGWRPDPKIEFWTRRW